ncbi:MAG: TonB-dependent receptor [Bacteroidota bacterium]
MKRFSLVLIMLCGSAYSFAQNKVTISGYIRDAGNGEDLIGATIQVVGSTNGAVTNVYGFYSLTIPSGNAEIRISYIGFDPISVNKEFVRNETLSVNLNASAEQLQEVIITGEAENANVVNNQMSVAKLEPKTIKQVPAVLGEADVIRSIQLLPGITSVADGASGFNVRGGAADQNLILLDEGIIYNSAHLLGLYSVVNPDAIKDVQIYKGGIPARYGGRLSSVLDIRQREGNSKEFNGEAGIGLISARALIEGPIVTDKGSFMIAGRRSYGDAFLRLTGNDNTAYFYDLNVKTNYTINDRNRVFLSGYFGRDKFELGSIFSNSWGNATGTLRWNHLFSNKLFANFSAIYSNYDYSIDQLSTGAEFNRASNIITYNLKGDFNYFINDRNSIEFGADNKWYEFRPGAIRPIEGSNVLSSDLDEKFGQELGAYVSYETKLGNLILNGGVRYSRFLRQGKQDIAIYANDAPLVYNSTVGRYENGEVIDSRSYSSGETISDFGNFEPRLAATYVINERNSIKASYNRLYQYLHLISNSNSPTPLDVWAPSGPFIKPQQVDQIAVGYFRNFKDNTFEASIEGYYKEMDNLVDFVDGADLLTTNTLETEILPGIGRSYGLELYIKKNKGKLTGWISYTLSRAERKVEGITAEDPGINNGDWYAANYDKRNDLSITGIYQLNDRWSLSGNFIYATGAPTTYPIGRYEYAGLVIPQFESRNQERLPDYHRLDISATLKGKRKRWKNGGHEWVFGFNNLYNRANATSIYFVEDEDNPGQAKAFKSFLFGITPSVTYNFKF